MVLLTSANVLGRYKTWSRWDRGRPMTEALIKSSAACIPLSTASKKSSDSSNLEGQHQLSAPRSAPPKRRPIQERRVISSVFPIPYPFCPLFSFTGDLIPSSCSNKGFAATVSTHHCALRQLSPPILPSTAPPPSRPSAAPATLLHHGD